MWAALTCFIDLHGGRSPSRCFLDMFWVFAKDPQQIKGTSGLVRLVSLRLSLSVLFSFSLLRFSLLSSLSLLPSCFSPCAPLSSVLRVYPLSSLLPFSLISLLRASSFSS